MQSNDTEIIDLFVSDSIERLEELFGEQNKIVLEILVSRGDYATGIASRELIASIFEYDYISSFSEDRAWAYKNDRTDLLDDRGDVLKSFNYRSFNFSPFIDGVSVVSYDTSTDMTLAFQYLLVNKQGKRIAGPFAGILGKPTEKILCFRKENGISERTDLFVRHDGTVVEGVIPATPFSENRAWIKAQDNSAELILVDEEFNAIARRIGNSATAMSSERSWVNTGGTMYDLVNEKGELVNTLNLAHVTEFKDGYSIISMVSGGIAFVNQAGDIVFGQYLGVAPFSEGLAAIRRPEDGRYIYISSPSGLPRFTNDLQGYNEASSFSEGYAVILENPDDYYFIDHHGDNPFGRHFEFATSFEDGVAKVGIDGKYYWIDHSGQIVFGPVERSEE